MKRVLLLTTVVILLFLSSCKSDWYCQRCPVENESTTITFTEDSIIYETVLFDSTIFIPLPQDEMLIRALIKCDSNNKAQMKEMVFKSRNQYVRMKIENGVLVETVRLTEDSLSKTINLQNQIITKLRREKVEASTTKTIKVKYIPPVTRIMSIIGWVLSIAGILFFLYNIKNIFRIRR